MRRVSFVCFVVILTSFAPDLRGQNRSVSPRATMTHADSVLEAQTTAVASTLRCPVCQGESIQDSPADLARQMRELVRERLKAGQTPDQVRAYFVSRYGEWILLKPAMTGLNVALYALPVVLVVGGLVGVVLLVRRWTAPADRADEQPAPNTQ